MEAMPDIGRNLAQAGDKGAIAMTDSNITAVRAKSLGNDRYKEQDNDDS